MTHALQVSFRRVLPSEKVVELAARRFAHVRRARLDVRECSVTVETASAVQAGLLQVVVAMHGREGLVAESTGIHREASTALAMAFAAVQTRLGVFPAFDDPCWANPVHRPQARAVGSR